jgi:nucleoside-diphosphate-sugar epimerase
VEDLVSNGAAMRILVTGNMGYVGPIVVRHLRRQHPTAELIGFDNGYFAHCLTASRTLPEASLDAQHFGDVRKFPERLLDGVDSVVHLAAVSNDPMGNKFAAVTEDINYRASVRLADMAARNGVKRFVFASSCSVYGSATSDARREEDPLNPLTAYAKSKVATEQALAQMDRRGMVATCLRFATACGMSDRLRLDLVLNDFVASAVAGRVVAVLSDGTPWRPLIDICDMARAVDWAVSRSAENGGEFLAVNAGSDSWNMRVKDLARAVAATVPGTEVSINTAAQPDKRSYRVDFSRFRSLAPDHQPQVTLQDSIMRLHEGLMAIGFSDRDFRNSQQIRLKVLEDHIASGRLSPNLDWQRTNG